MSITRLAPFPPIEATVGDTVRWTNNHGGNVHEIAGVANAFRSSGVLRFGESYSITLSTVGEITYFDTFHPSIMVGTCNKDE